MIGEYFHIVIWLLEIVTPMTEILIKSKKFSIIDVVVFLNVDHFAWEVGYNFPLCVLFQ